MNQVEKSILLAVGATEASTFNEILAGMGDDKPGEANGVTWGFFLSTIRSLERHGYIEVDRDKADRINSAILTEAGQAEARALRG